MEIRQAEAPDFISVHTLICELAAYEKAPNEVVTDAETAVNAQQKEANALQQSIQTTATHLQTVVQALGQ